MRVSQRCHHRPAPSGQCALPLRRQPRGQRRAPRAAALPAEHGDGMQEPQIQPVQGEDLPEALQGLSLRDDGRGGSLLIDEKTGKEVNEFGATRWDVAVTALRGELDPPAWVENSERTPGILLGALVQFPTRHCFSVVGANAPGMQRDVVEVITSVCQVPLEEVDVKAVERLRGRFLSLQVEAMVRAPELIEQVVVRLRQDARIKYVY